MRSLEDLGSAEVAPTSNELGESEPRSGDAGAARADSPAGRRNFWEPALGKLSRIDGGEPLLICSLLALCVLVKVLWLTPVDMYWDAGAKWHFVRQWFYTNDFSHAHWSHHMARFGVNVPAYFSQLIFGTSSSVYFVTPIAMYTLGTLFVYLTAKRLAGRAAGVLGALFMTFFPAMSRSASQLLPDGMVGTAAVVAAYAFVRFHESEGKTRWRFLIAVALGCLWTYAIKESSVLLFPGFVLAVFLSRRSYKEAAVFVGCLALYGVLETLGFRLFTDYAHRLAVVQEEHGFYPPTKFWGLFGRFAKLAPSFQMLFWLWVASVIYDAGWGDRKRRLFQVLPLVFVLGLTFNVRRIDPIIQWLSFKPRYMEPGAELFVVGAAACVTDNLRRIGALFENPRLRASYDKLVGLGPALVFAGCLLLGTSLYLSAREDFPRHPLKLLRRDSVILNDTFKRNLPIVEHTSKGNPRGLNTVYSVYMRADYLAQSNLATGGRLPDIQEAVRFVDRKHRLAYVLRDDSGYGRGDLQRLVDAGCAITVSTKHGVRLSSESKLPARCRAPRGKEPEKDGGAP